MTHKNNSKLMLDIKFNDDGLSFYVSNLTASAIPQIYRFNISGSTPYQLNGTTITQDVSKNLLVTVPPSSLLTFQFKNDYL